ncbi:MAG: FUSC family protein [Betaproteobacteria bacterium]|nr:FUSC family protein [Betaproteobacteria bacterium]
MIHHPLLKHFYIRINATLDVAAQWGARVVSVVAKFINVLAGFIAAQLVAAFACVQRAMRRFPVAVAQLTAAATGKSGERWIFIGKTLLAALLALWISMRLDLEQPRTAMLTVFIVMQPKVGMVFAKNFYRSIATVVGVGVGLLLLANFAQQEILFLGAMALWIGVCVFGAASYRNFRSYGFVLAGYTSAIVGLPAAQQPDMAFVIALSRLTEVMLGILCAGIVSAAVFPLRANEDLEPAMRRRYRDFLKLTTGVLSGAATSAGLDRKTVDASLLKYVKDVVAFETARDMSLFEEAEVRLNNRHLLWLNRRFMTLSTTFHTLQSLIERLQRSHRTEALQALQHVFVRLSETLSPPEASAAGSYETGDRTDAHATLARLIALRAELPTLIAAAREALNTMMPVASIADNNAAATPVVAPLLDERVADFLAASELLSRFVWELIEYLASYSHAPRHGSDSAPNFVPLADPLMAAISGLRAVLAVAILGAFWLASGWSNGPGAIVLAAVMCALFASSPSPDAAVRKMTLGLVLGFVSGFICAFFVLTQLGDGFFPLCVAIAPFMLIGPWLAGSPKWSGVGGGYNIFMINGMALTNPMSFDVAAFINNGISDLVGAAVAGVIFIIVMPSGGALWRRFWRAMLLRHAAAACTAPLAKVEQHFESGLHDNINNLGALTLAPKLQRGLFDWAVVVYETGRIVVDMRRDLQSLPLDAPQRDAIEAVISAIGAFFKKPDDRRHHETMTAIEAALSCLMEAANRAKETAQSEQSKTQQQAQRETQRQARRRFLASLHLLRAAWIDPASLMHRYAATTAVPSPAVIPTVAGGTHAA